MNVVSERHLERNAAVKRVLAVILVVNWAVAAAKLAVGLFVNSAAVTADGLHSFIDGASNVIGLVAMHFASQPADSDHPYGHGKFEAIASLAIGAMVGVGMFELGSMAIKALIHGVHPRVGVGTAALMGATLVVNVIVTSVEHRYARKLQSSLLLADSRHTLSDVFVSAAVLVSIGLVAMGMPGADAVVALIVLGFVAYAAYEIVSQSVNILTDTARLDPEAVRRASTGVSGVIAVKDVRSRGMEGSVYVDLKIEVDPSLSTASAHEVANRVEHALAELFPEIVDVVVHVEPAAFSSAPAQPS